MYNQKSICQQQGARKATTSGYAARQPLNVSQHFFVGPKPKGKAPHTKLMETTNMNQLGNDSQD